MKSFKYLGYFNGNAAVEYSKHRPHTICKYMNNGDENFVKQCNGGWDYSSVMDMNPRFTKDGKYAVVYDVSLLAIDRWNRNKEYNNDNEFIDIFEIT